jgi:hypothetical protein
MAVISFLNQQMRASPLHLVEKNRTTDTCNQWSPLGQKKNDGIEQL